MVERDRLDQRRVVHGELLHLEVVVRQVAVGRAAARQPEAARRARVRASRRALRRVLRREVGDPDAVAEAGRAQLAGVGAAVEHDLDGVGVAVLGQVEPERLQALLVRARAGWHVDDLELPAFVFAMRVKWIETSRARRAPRKRHAWT